MSENSRENSYDVAIIGSGPGGYVAAIRAAQLGFKTVCIEKEATLGGTCLNVGCIPSKALLYSSESFHFIQKYAPLHGIKVAGLQLDFTQMMKHKSEVVNTLVQGVAGLFKKNHVTKIFGTAHLLNAHEIEVIAGNDKLQIRAQNIILATGSESIELPFLPFDEKMVLSSTGALCLSQVPKRMVVIGGGVIGVELASVYSRLGTEVVIVEMLDRICPSLDTAISKTLLQVLRKQGIQFYLGTKVAGVDRDTHSLTVHISFEGQEISLVSDCLLVAIGRRPYHKGLELAHVGIKISDKGFVEVNQNFQTAIPSVFAIGDLIEGAMLAHRASEEGIAVVEYLAGITGHINYLSIPTVIYTRPEVAAIGLTEQEARDAKLNPFTGMCLFKANARARCAGDTDGFVKIVGDKDSGRLIGMHIIGPHASELIGEGIIAMDKKATVSEIAYAVHAHPTLSEAIKEAALKALGHAIHF